MMAMLKTAREWWLVTACAALLLFALFRPTGIEFYPVLDWRGGNEFNMRLERDVYHCGDTPKAHWIYQKQRMIVGTIKWCLVPSFPNGVIQHYMPRKAAMPVGIYNVWADIETLPEYCQPGRYHWEGMLEYPLWIGHANYGLRTQDFEVVE